MKVIDHQEREWFLFDHEGKLYLEANCSHSFIGYSYMIELNDDERKRYEDNGRKYLSRLASDIHNSAPIMKGSKSFYLGRDETNRLGEKAGEAVKAWKISHEQRLT